MAKYEREGICPQVSFDLSGKVYLTALWSLFGKSVVYEREDAPDTKTCDRVFDTDPIAYDLLVAIARKNANADKVLVHQLHNGACNTQSVSDVQKTLAEATNPQLIAHAGSDFVVVIADASYGIDVWVWDLKNCR